MKKSATNLLMLLCIGAFAIGISSIASSCSKDGDGGGSAKDICDIDECKNNSNLKDACIEKVERCLEVDQGDHDECTVIAIDACGL